MNSLTFAFLFVAPAAYAQAQDTVATKPRMTEQQVLDIATPALSERFPAAFKTHQPYCAQFSHGDWWVLGTVPKGVRGGGAPEATVRDSDGKILTMSLGR